MKKLNKNLDTGEKLKIFGPAIIITCIGFLVAYQFVAPAPPRKITMGSGFESIGQFPAPKYLDFKLSEEANRFYESGQPFFQRYLPFWVANFIDRMKIMLLPLIALLFPFFKLMPPIYRWRMRSRIYRWYPKLGAIDAEIFEEKITENLDKYLTDLDDLEKEVSNISVPLAFSEELYDLRLHIDLLRKKLQKVKDAGKSGVN